MSYFDRLEAKLKEIEAQETKAQEELLKIQDLTHKATVAKQYNEIYSEYLNLKRELDSDLLEIEKEKSKLNQMAVRVKEEVSLVEMMFDQYNEIKNAILIQLKREKNSIGQNYLEFEERIYEHGDHLVNSVERFIGYEHPTSKNESEEQWRGRIKKQNDIKYNLRKYFEENCSTIEDVSPTEHGRLRELLKKLNEKGASIRKLLDSRNKIG